MVSSPPLSSGDVAMAPLITNLGSSLINNSRIDTASSQPGGQHQSRRTSANDENVDMVGCHVVQMILKSSRVRSVDVCGVVA